MTATTSFTSLRVVTLDRRVARRIAAVSHPQNAYQSGDVRSFLDGTDLCSRGLAHGRQRGGDD